jgi:hypothetical protein
MKKPPQKSLGQIGYEEYSKGAGWCAWKDLGKSAQDAHNRIARAVERAVLERRKKK